VCNFLNLRGHGHQKPPENDACLSRAFTFGWRVARRYYMTLGNWTDGPIDAGIRLADILLV